MTPFHIEIKTRIEQLRQSGQIAFKTKQFSKVYLGTLVDSDWNNIKQLNDFQVAFLDLLNERYPSLFTTIKEPLEKVFYDMYRNSDDEEERNYKVEKELLVSGLQIPSEENENDEWQIIYAMESDETIFHIYMRSWTFDYIGLTH